MDDHYSLPEPIGAAMHFVERTNDARATGVQIDAAQVLASKVACVALREYFSRVANAVESGLFDPSFVGMSEDYLDGEEERQAEAD